MDSITTLLFAHEETNICLKIKLKPDGLLCFVCKSTKDPLYGQGNKIEEDVFEHGHVRHFFSEEYARKCLERRYKIEKIESGEATYYGDRSAFVKVIARVL